MRARWRIVIGAAPLLGALVIAVAMGFAVPLPYTKTDRETEIVGHHLRKSWNEWVDHGLVSTWTGTGVEQRSLLYEGRYRYGTKVGEWRYFTPGSDTPREVESYDDAGRRTLTLRYQDGWVRYRDEESMDPEGNSLRTTKTLDRNGATLQTRKFRTGDLIELDGLSVTLETSPEGLPDRLVHRETTADGKSLVITYHIDTRQNVREVVRTVDGVEVERVRKEPLSGPLAPEDDTYDFEHHTWKSF